MKASIRLLQPGIKLILFSRPTCSLCDTAKLVVSNVRKQHPAMDYSELDVMSKGNEGWKALYEFDTPVLHVQPSTVPVDPKSSSEVLKLMHRFSEDQVNDLINNVQNST